MSCVICFFGVLGAFESIDVSIDSIEILHSSNRISQFRYINLYGGVRENPKIVGERRISQPR